MECEFSSTSHEKWHVFHKGLKVAADDEKMIFEILKNAQAKNKRLGYGDDSKEWKKEPYSVKLKELNDKRRYRGLNKLK